MVLLVAEGATNAYTARFVKVAGSPDPVHNAGVGGSSPPVATTVSSWAYSDHA